MPPKHPLLQKCLSYLEALPHLKVEAEVGAVPYAETVLADGQIVLHSPQGSTTYIVEIKSDTTIETLSFLIEYLKQLKQQLSQNQKPLLIAKKLSKLVTKRLIQENLEFIDTAGNCYLNSPALYLLTSSSALENEKPAKSLEITVSTLKLMYALLLSESPEISKAKFDEIAKIAGISASNVEQSLDRLHNLKYLQRQPRGGYRIVSREKLLERWELGYAESLRSHLLIGTYSPASGKQFSEVEATIVNHAEDEGYLIGGELGGAIATKYLTPIGATLHLPENKSPTSLYLNLKLKPDQQGSITFLRQFGTQNGWTNRLANPLLIHAEMMTLAIDERIQETSDRLYHQYLATEALK